MKKNNNKMFILGSISLVATLLSGYVFYSKTTVNKTELNKIDSKGTEITELILPGNGDTNEFHDAKLNIKNKLSFTSEGNVYKFKKELATEKEAIKIAQQFGIKGKLTSDADTYHFNSDTISFRYEKATSMWSYDNLTKMRDIPSKGVKISDDKKIIEIAKAQLKKYNLNLAVFDNPIVTYQTEQGATETVAKIRAKDVYFYRKLNGRPVLGTSRVIVIIGNNDEVVSICKYFRDIEEKPYKARLNSQPYVLDSIKDGNAVVNFEGKNKSLKQIDVTNARLDYWEDESNNFLQPVYILEGNDSENPGDKFTAYVPAVEKGQTIK